MVGSFTAPDLASVLLPIATRQSFNELGVTVDLRRYAASERSTQEWFYSTESIDNLKWDVDYVDLILLAPTASGSGDSPRREIARSSKHEPLFGRAIASAKAANVPVAIHSPVSTGQASWCLDTEGCAPLYANVADENARAYLAEKGGRNIVFAPDPLNAINVLLTERSKTKAFVRSVERYTCGEPYLVTARPTSWLSNDGTIAVTRRDGATPRYVVGLPAFTFKKSTSNEDDDSCQNVASHLVAPEPLLWAEILARSEGYVGHDRGLAATARAVGVPVFANERDALLPTERHRFRPNLRDTPGSQSEILRQNWQVAPIDDVVSLAEHYEKLISVASA
jgi:hypothetical protein